MRALSESQLAALSNANGCNRRGRVRLLGPDGTWRDLSALPVGSQLEDYLEEVTVDDSLDEPVSQARVRVKRAMGAASLAPLMADSPLNYLTTDGGYEALLRGGRVVEVSVAVSPLGYAPVEEDWLEVFYGRIDNLSDSGDVIELTARSYAGVLQDTQIGVERTYGSTAGVPVQTVMQSILNDNGLSAFGLYVPEDPGFVLGPYLQQRQSVLEALSALATQAGMDLRYEWSPVANAFALGLYLPERDATTPVWTYDADAYQSLPQVDVPDEDVRTSVTVWYWDKANLDASGNPTKTRVDRQADAATVAEFGVRHSEIALAATDNIDTAAEAGRLADAFIADCAQPPLSVSVEVPAHPGLQLGDMVCLKANGVQYSADQTASLRSWTLTVNLQKVTTQLVLRGKPALGQRTWLSREAGRPGLPRTTPYTGPSAPTVLSAVPQLNGLSVTVAPSPTGPDTDTYELHVSTTSGFTPDAGNPSTTLKQVSNSTRLALSTLTAGTTYYGRVVARDALGNRGPASPQFTLAAAYLPPAGLLPNISWDERPLNGNLEAWTVAGAPPDGCKMVSGTWGVDAFQETGVVFSGAASLRLKAQQYQEVSLAFQAFAVRPGEGLAVKALAYAAVVGVGAILRVRWLSGSFATVSLTYVTSPTFTSSTAGTWQTASGYVTVPTGVRYAQVEVGVGAAGSAPSLYVDSVVAQLGLLAVPTWAQLRSGVPINDYTNGWSPDATRPFAWRINSLGEVECRGSIKGGALGSPCFTLAGAAPSGTTTTASPARFRVSDGASGEATVSVYASSTTPTSAVFVVSGTTNAQVALDGVRYSVA